MLLRNRDLARMKILAEKAPDRGREANSKSGELMCAFLEPLSGMGIRQRPTVWLGKDGNWQIAWQERDKFYFNLSFPPQEDVVNITRWERGMPSIRVSVTWEEAEQLLEELQLGKRYD